MTPQEIENIINEFIIDNNTNQVTPAKLRFVLKTINDAIKITDPASVTALAPLVLNPFSNEFSINPVTETQDGFLNKNDYILFKNNALAPANLFQFVQKGFGKTGLPGEVGDVYRGWSNDGTIRISEAIYNGGSLEDSNNFTPLVQTEI